MTNNCDFCDRVTETFCIIEESTHSYAKICKWPLHPSHTLIIPKRHVAELSELEPSEAADLLGLVTTIAKRIESRYDEPPKLFQNYGKHRSQPHLHLHLISVKDDLRTVISGSSERIVVPNDKMTEFAQKLK